MNILFFGILSDVTGQGQIKLDGQVTDTKELQENLYEKFPELKKYTFRLAVNQELVDETRSLNQGDIIAIMPPFNGG